MQKKLLETVFCRLKGEPFAVTYWDGETKVYEAEEGQEPAFRLIINEKLNLKEMFLEPEVKFGEAYMDKKIDYEGDLKAIFSLVIQNEGLFKGSTNEKGRLHHLFSPQRAGHPPVCI